MLFLRLLRLLLELRACLCCPRPSARLIHKDTLVCEERFEILLETAHLLRAKQRKQLICTSRLLALPLSQLTLRTGH